MGRAQGSELVPREAVDGLRPRGRLFACLASLVLTGLGAWATFATSNQAGSLGLLATGAVLGLMALTGQSLQRIKIGDNEATFFERVGRATLDEAAQEDPDSLEEGHSALAVVESVAAVSAAVPAEVLRLSEDRESARRYEEAVGAALARLGVGAQQSRRPGPDFVVDRVGVECKYRAAGRPPGLGSVQPGGSYYPSVVAAARAGLEKLVILTNSKVILDESARIPVGNVVVHVRLGKWQPEDGDQALAQLVQIDSSGSI